jgi:hypothetical protein
MPMLHKSVNKCSAHLAQTSGYCDDGHDRWTIQYAKYSRVQGRVVFKIAFSTAFNYQSHNR